MDLLHPVKEVMMDGVSSLFKNQNVTDFKLSIPPTILEGSVKIKLKKVSYKKPLTNMLKSCF